MTANEYQQLAMTTLNPELSERDMLINGVMGLCGESGEVIDLVKKHISHGHPLDEGKLAAELGDVMWYIAELATVLGITLEDIMTGNVEKLRRRYPDGFSTADSMVRKD